MCGTGRTDVTRALSPLSGTGRSGLVPGPTHRWLARATADRQSAREPAVREMEQAAARRAESKYRDKHAFVGEHYNDI